MKAAVWTMALALTIGGGNVQAGSGRIVVWGDDNYGMYAAPSGHDFTQVAGGQFHSLALRADGSLAGWGWGQWGATQVPGGSDYIAIAAGAAHSLSLKADGSLEAWGDF